MSTDAQQLMRTGSGRGKAAANTLLQRTKSTNRKLDEAQALAHIETFYRPLFVLFDDDNNKKVSMKEFTDTACSAFKDPLHAADIIRDFWPVEDEKPLDALNAGQWVQAWNKYWHNHGTDACRAFMFTMLVAANEHKDHQSRLDGTSPRDVEDAMGRITETTPIRPDSSLELAEKPAILALVEELWKTLDFLGGENGGNDCIEDVELLFLKGPHFAGIFDEVHMDENNDNRIDWSEWQAFWNDRLKRGGELLVIQELELSIMHVRRVSKSFKEACQHQIGDGFSAALKAVHSEETQERNDIMCYGALAAVVASIMVGGAIWMTRKN